MARSGMSQRRAARLVGCDPKTLRREPDRRDDHIRERLRHHAAERRRFGYRRLGLMLERENITMNEKKLYRLYKEEGLAVRRRLWCVSALRLRNSMPVLRFCPTASTT